MAETRAEVVAALRRNHPELSDAQLDALLSGEPPRRRRPVPVVVNRGKHESRYSSVSTGRTTPGHGTVRPEPS